MTGGSEIRRAALRLMLEAMEGVDARTGTSPPIGVAMRQHLLQSREPPLDGPRAERWLQVLQARALPWRLAGLDWPLSHVLVAHLDLPGRGPDLDAWLLDELDRL